MGYWKILVFSVGICTNLSFSSEDTQVIHFDCNSEAVLPCTAKSYSHVYTSITWYKGTPEQGIIRRQKGTNEPVPYSGYANTVSLTEENALVLKNVTFNHTGMYKCLITASVGHKSNQSHVFLNISECVTKTTETPVLTTQIVTQSTSLGRNLSEVSRLKPVEVNGLLAFVGFGTIGLIKVLLCALCVSIVVAIKKHRRSRNLWN
ncbi:uncharacterized protein [Hoplias malabaricus]|uniref:uncharacterized protein n=1 Tax=Hoplias malabaricus TaxID=27720 RepID=UPI003461AB4D